MGKFPVNLRNILFQPKNGLYFRRHSPFACIFVSLTLLTACDFCYSLPVRPVEEATVNPSSFINIGELIESPKQLPTVTHVDVQDPDGDSLSFCMAMAAGGKKAQYGSVQAQRLFFLIDKELSDLLEGPFIDLLPYDYGPFDKDLYSSLDVLKESGQVLVNHSGRYRSLVGPNTWGLLVAGSNPGIPTNKSKKATLAFVN